MATKWWMDKGQNGRVIQRNIIWQQKEMKYGFMLHQSMSLENVWFGLASTPPTPIFNNRLGKEYKSRFFSDFTYYQDRNSLRTWFGKLGKAPGKPRRVESWDFCPAMHRKNQEGCLVGNIDEQTQLGEQQVLCQGQSSRMKLMLEVHQVFWTGSFRMGVPRVSMGRRGGHFKGKGLHSLFRCLKFEELISCI